MEAILESLLQDREPYLAYYSPCSFIRQVDLKEHYHLLVKPKIMQYGSDGPHLQFMTEVGDTTFLFLYEHLQWDSKYFNRPCYKLFTVLYKTQNSKKLLKAIAAFKEFIGQKEKSYCFAEIPCEDIFLIQCLTEAGLKQVETRFLYFKENLETFSGNRYPVREAGNADSEILAKIAGEARNMYDRLHADYAFSDEESDAYLATYAAATVNGFCDHVLVPHEPGLKTASFIAFKKIRGIYQGESPDLFRVNLAAVGPENKGWLQKLMTELLYFAKERKASYVLYPTQATNRAVIRVCEKLGFILGSTSCLLAFHSK